MDVVRWTMFVLVAVTGAMALVVPWHEVRITNEGNGSGDTEVASDTVWGQSDIEFGPDGIWYAQDYDGKPGAAALRAGLPLFVAGVALATVGTLLAATGRAGRATTLLVLGAALPLGIVGALLLNEGMGELTQATRDNYSNFIGVTFDANDMIGVQVGVAWVIASALALGREWWVGRTVLRGGRAGSQT